jgi:hypothetical protein
MIHPFTLQQSHGAFHGGVVPRITLATYAALDPMGIKDPLKRVGCILAAPVAVVDEAAIRLARRECISQGHTDQFGIDVCRRGPANDASRAQVQDDGQIKPAFARPNIREIRHPLFIEVARREVPLQSIGCGLSKGARPGRANESRPWTGPIPA